MDNKIFYKKYSDLYKYLSDNSIIIKSTLADNEFISGISSLENANNDQITFFENTKLLNSLNKTKAKACFIKDEFVNLLPKSCSPIIVLNPYLCFAHTTNFFSPKRKTNGKVSKNSFIHDNAKISNNIEVGNFSTLSDNCEISKNVIIENNVIIDRNVKIGENSFIGNNCVISNAIIGKNCFIDSGTIIGGSGFGFTINEKVSIEHIGNVIIEDNVKIGSNCTIDRASIDSTIIETNVRLDNLIQIAHGVKICKNSTIAAQVGIAGSTIIGSNCIIGGQAGISGHLKIGNNVKIAAKSGVTKNIKDNMTIAGFPAIDITKWKKNIIKLNNN